MSQMTLSVLDAQRAIHNRKHASFADVLIPALSDDPETIEELAHAIQRFTAPGDEDGRLADWPAGECDEPFDAGVCLVDLAARLIVYQSTYCGFLRRGRVTCDEIEGDGEGSARWIPYYISDDWLVTDQLDGWRERSRERRQERQAHPPFDTREVLYEKVIEFIADECLAARGGSTDADGRWTPPSGWRWRELPERAGRGDSLDERDAGGGVTRCKEDEAPRVYDAVAEIHARWLMTAQDDLRGQTPRDVLHARRSDLSLHLQDRQSQWSSFRQQPPTLWRESIAYRYAGYGVHEIVIYYYLLRHLIQQCWDMVQPRPGEALPTKAAIIDRLSAARQDWMHTPDQEDLTGSDTPARVIECERLRLPLAVSGEEAMVDPDCPLCQMTADSAPMFWHLDGCEMDEEFPFEVFFTTRKEWEAEERDQAELDAKLESEDQARAAAGQNEDPVWSDQDEGDESSSVWECSFGAPDADESPEITLFGLGACLSELIVDLRRAGDSQDWIDTLNRDYGNLREAVADPASSLVEPVVAKFSEHLDAVSEVRPDLSAKCGDLRRRLDGFARRLSGEPTMDDDLPF